MRREIKFRAWIPDEYGDDGNTPISFIMIDWFDGFFSDMSPVTFFGSSISNDAILMQFTGLKDKNGKEIYEGDICRTYHYKEDADGWRKLTDDNKIYENVLIKYETKTPFCGFVIQSFYEVIGNIYENPELLKKEE